MLVASLIVTSLASAGLVSAHTPRKASNHAAAARRMREARSASDYDTEVELGKRLAPYHAKRGEQFRGRGTFYDVEEVVCACGDWHKNHEYVVAMNTAQYGNGYPSDQCWKYITVQANGVTVKDVMVVDECPLPPTANCTTNGDIDLSPDLFSRFADHHIGVLDATWWWQDGPEGGDGGDKPKPSSSSTSEWHEPSTSEWHPPSTSESHEPSSTSTWEAPSSSESPSPSPSPEPSPSTSSSESSWTSSWTSSSAWSSSTQSSWSSSWTSSSTSNSSTSAASSTSANATVTSAASSTGSASTNGTAATLTASIGLNLTGLGGDAPGDAPLNIESPTNGTNGTAASESGLLANVNRIVAAYGQIIAQGARR